MRARVRQAIALVLVVVVGAGVAGAVWAWHAAHGDPQAHVVSDGDAADGWKTIDYARDELGTVRVDIPEDWQRVDLSGCEFRWERWGPPGPRDCQGDGPGVSFYASATFDPAYGPGIRRGLDGRGGPGWSGYVDAGDWVIYAAADDREVVDGILSSARPVT